MFSLQGPGLLSKLFQLIILANQFTETDIPMSEWARPPRMSLCVAESMGGFLDFLMCKIHANKCGHVRVYARVSQCNPSLWDALSSSCARWGDILPNPTGEWAANRKHTLATARQNHTLACDARIWDTKSFCMSCACACWVCVLRCKHTLLAGCGQVYSHL